MASNNAGQPSQHVLAPPANTNSATASSQQPVQPPFFNPIMHAPLAPAPPVPGFIAKAKARKPGMALPNKITQNNANGTLDMDVQKLSVGEMVTVKIRPRSLDAYRSFYIVRECIRAKSAYFRAAFEGGFAETRLGAISLDDVPYWLFASVVHWLYTDKLSLVGERCDEMTDAHDRRDPLTWPYSVLLKLYIFADKYDTRELRNLVFEHIQVSIMKKDSVVPHRRNIATVYENLPASNPLRTLMVESWVICDDDRTEKTIAEYAQQLPVQFLADFAARSMRRMQALHCYKCGGRARHPEVCTSKTHTAGDARDLYQRDWCELHDHVTKEEKDLCKSRRKAMDDKFEKRTNH